MSGPVFIGGCPRAGTTALWNALTKHPGLAPAPGSVRDKELWFLTEFFEGRSLDDVARRSNPLDVEFEREGVAFIDAFLLRKCGSRTGRYVTAIGDNILWADRIARLVPGSRILLVLRHPQDNVWSLLNAFFSGYIRRSRSADLITEDEAVRATQIWKRRAEIVLRALDGALGPNVRVVRQERMAGAPEELAREVLEFVGEEFDPAVASALSGGIINTSFPPGREASESSFLEVIPVAGDAARHDFYRRNRRSPIFTNLVCPVVRTLAATEMRLLGYEDLAAQAAAEAAAEAEAEPAGATAAASGSRPPAVELAEIVLRDDTGALRSSFEAGETATLHVAVKANAPVAHLSISFLARDADGVSQFGTTTFDEGVRLPPLAAGQELPVRFRFPLPVRHGAYRISVSCNSVSDPGYADNVLHQQLDDVVAFDVAFSPRRPVHYRFVLPTGIEVGPAG